MVGLLEPNNILHRICPNRQASLETNATKETAVNVIDRTEIIFDLRQIRHAVDELIRRVEQDESESVKSRLSEIELAVAAEFGVDRAMLMIRKRQFNSSWPRFVAIALAIDRLPVSWEWLQTHYRFKSNKSISHARTWVRKKCQDPQFKQRIERIRRLLNEDEKEQMDKQTL